MRSAPPFSSPTPTPPNQFRAQISLDAADSKSDHASDQPPLTYEQMERSFDEECPLPPRGDLVRVDGEGGEVDSAALRASLVF